LARRATPLIEADLRQLHHLVVQRSQPEAAGHYVDQARYVLTDSGRRGFPSPAEVPALMGDFARWLVTAPDTPAARLLMNLILLRGGYPPVAARPQDRPAYLSALQEALAGHSASNSDGLLYQRLDTTLDEYLCAAQKR